MRFLALSVAMALLFFAGCITMVKMSEHYHCSEHFTEVCK